MGFAVNADVGSFIEPSTAFNLDRLEGRDFQAAQEVLFHVADTILHPSFLISLADITGHGFEAVMRCKIQVAWIEQGLFTERMAHHSHLQIIDHDFEG